MSRHTFAPYAPEATCGMPSSGMHTLPMLSAMCTGRRPLKNDDRDGVHHCSHKEEDEEEERKKERKEKKRKETEDMNKKK